MSKNLKNILKNLSVAELIAKIDELRRERFSLALHSVTSPIQDKTQFKKMKKDIARALTYLKQKQQSKVGAESGK